MSFYLRDNESVEAGIKRIVGEEIARAMDDIDSPKLKRIQAIHEVRKHCKKIRGVLRLVRPQLGEAYRLENAWFRDTAKGLAELRDAEAVIETCDSLMDTVDDEIDRRALAPVRRRLVLRRKAILKQSGSEEQNREEIRRRLREAAERASRWELSADGFDAIEAGLVATYRRARKAMKAAYDDPTAENFHEWRKQVKYHGYHIRVLRGLWERVMLSLRKEIDALSHQLGDDHNLAVFQKALLDLPEGYADKRTVQELADLSARTSPELRIKARVIGERVFAKRPKAFGRDFKAYWQAWRSADQSPAMKGRMEPGKIILAG